MPYDMETATWRDVKRFITDAKLDSDEYFAYSGDDSADEKRIPGEQIWSRDATHATRWIEVAWVPGGSEGYYVHVRKIVTPLSPHGIQNGPQQTSVRMLGKFWSPARAAFACDILTRFLYVLQDPQTLIQMGKDNFKAYVES